uniref:Putative ovule protein n=1 Tax=Solanum chacoense TaxID=4108 RepID=A0A0V0H6F9_SOLCH
MREHKNFYNNEEEGGQNIWYSPGAYCLRSGDFTSNSSIFRLNVAPGGISFIPLEPYPASGGTITVLFPPTFIPSVIVYIAFGGFGAA